MPPVIEPQSLEEAFLFLAQSVRAGESGDPRAADWLALGMLIVAKHVDVRDPHSGTPAGFVGQVLVPIGCRNPRTDRYLREGEIRSGWLHYEHKDGRQAICREGDASFTVGEPAWYRTGPVEFKPA